MAHLNINTGLGLGMTQLSNLARFGLFLIPGGNSHREPNEEENEEPNELDKLNDRPAFEPRIPGIEFVDLYEFDKL